MRIKLGFIFIPLVLGVFATSFAREYLVPPGVDKKYNIPKMTLYRFKSQKAFDGVRKRYKELMVPDIVENILLGKDYYARVVRLEHPHTLSWNERRDFLITQNPKYMFNDGKLVEDLSSLKNSKYGISAVGWFIHLGLFQESSFDPNAIHHQRPRCTREMGSFSLPSNPYLITILDLTPSHLDWLKNLRSMAYKHMEKVYSVDSKVDQIKMYFHFPYPEKTSTLHLHIRVNQGVNYAEQRRSFTLDEIISAFEKGQSIEEVIYKRQKESPLNGIIATEISWHLLQNIPDLEIMEIDNPYLKNGKV